MIDTALALVRDVRLIRGRISDEESEGQEAAALRSLSHSLVLLAGEVLAERIAPEDTVPLLNALDKYLSCGTIGDRLDASGQRAKGNWITIHGVHVLTDKSGTIVSGPKNLVGTSAYQAKSQSGQKGQKTASAGSKASATWANKPCTGFRNRSAEISHRKHWKEFGVKSNADYVAHANRLFTQRVGGNIDGYKRPDGSIVRYDMKTGEYVAGTPGGTLYTHFKPRFSKGKVNLTDAYAYYERLKKEEDGT